MDKLVVSPDASGNVMLLNSVISEGVRKKKKSYIPYMLVLWLVAFASMGFLFSFAVGTYCLILSHSQIRK